MKHWLPSLPTRANVKAAASSCIGIRKYLLQKWPQQRQSLIAFTPRVMQQQIEWLQNLYSPPKSQGREFLMGRLRTVNLLIQVACFVKKVFSIKRS
jgi:hypothetical protein